MASRDTEFAAFVDDRGPALWRTASLLELDSDAAEAALVSALASTARRWRSLSRDGDAELEVRGELYRELASAWRRTGSMLAVPPPEGLADAARPRQALGALNHADRALVVLTAYESLSPHEAAGLLRVPGDGADAALGSAAARLRHTAGAEPGAPLLPLLNAAALREVPGDLTARALAASRRSGRRTWLLVGAALAALVIALAAGSVLLSEAPDAPASAASLDRWGIPGELPAARGLPNLGEAPIDTASMAYIQQGLPVVVDAGSGEARTVLAGKPLPAWFDAEVRGGALLRRRAPFTQAVLSPDGQWLLLVQEDLRRALPGDTGDLYLVKIATGEVLPVRDAAPAVRAQGTALIADTVLAWAPGGGAFACVCEGRLAVYDLEPVAPRVVLASRPSYEVTDVAWGGSGLLARTTKGSWLSVSAGEVPVPALGDADAVAASTSTPYDLLVVSVEFIYALGSDPGPDGGSCVLWDAEFSDPAVVTPVPDRDGDLCTPVALQPARSGVLLVLLPDRPRPQPLPLDVVAVDADGASTVIASLPQGTTHASFAARLVG